jgi:type I restriction enzyme R subunit
LEQKATYGTAAELEWATRKRRIDPRLQAAGWHVVPFDPLRPVASCDSSAILEYATDNGPADYALCVQGQTLGVVEAKKLTLAPENVLTQAERYSRGAKTSSLNFDGYRIPFLYATNGEVIWFRDARHPLNRSRRIAQFHTPDALAELLSRDLDGDCRALVARVNDHPMMRPYQVEANTATEGAIRVHAARGQADDLVQAILANAFRGELVPTEAELARRQSHDFKTATTMASPKSGYG